LKNTTASNTYEIILDSVTNPVSGEWYHVAGTWSSGDYGKLYVNGVLESTTPEVVGGEIRFTTRC